MVESASVVDWEGNVLQEGSNGYTCLPTAPTLVGTAPMCMDSEWMKWADAWENKKEYAPETLGISYMLAGDEGASNVDPYAEGPSHDNEWINEGAHLMILAPAGLLDAFRGRGAEIWCLRGLLGRRLRTETAQRCLVVVDSRFPVQNRTDQSR